MSLEEMTDQDIIEGFTQALDDLHDEGGQTFESTDFIAQGLHEYEIEIERRGLIIEYECPDGGDCMYGCPPEL